MTDPGALQFITNSGNDGANAGRRTWAKHIGEFVYNVKNWGAKGDFNPTTGVGTDDTAAINACIAEAFVYDTWQTWSLSDNKKLVYFPPGIYKTTDSINMPAITHGSMLYGAGMGVSVIKNVATTNPQNIIIFTDGLLNHTVRDLSLWGQPGDGSWYTGSQCYHFDSGPVGGGGHPKELCWINVEFKGCDIGLRAGQLGQCDVSWVVNCWFHNHPLAGISTHGGNTLQWQILGGQIDNCRTGINVGAGNIPLLRCVCFFNNEQNDMFNGNFQSLTMIGCYSDSPALNAHAAGFGASKMIADTYVGTFVGPVAGAFFNIGSPDLVPNGRSIFCMDACYVPNSPTCYESAGGNFSRVYARGNIGIGGVKPTFAGFGGTVLENI